MDSRTDVRELVGRNLHSLNVSAYPFHAKYKEEISADLH